MDQKGEKKKQQISGESVYQQRKGEFNITGNQEKTCTPPGKNTNLPWSDRVFIRDSIK